MKKVVRNVVMAASVVLDVGVSAQEATPSAVEYTCLIRDVVFGSSLIGTRSKKAHGGI